MVMWELQSQVVIGHWLSVVLSLPVVHFFCTRLGGHIFETKQGQCSTGSRSNSCGGYGHLSRDCIQGDKFYNCIGAHFYVALESYLSQAQQLVTPIRLPSNRTRWTYQSHIRPQGDVGLRDRGWKGQSTSVEVVVLELGCIQEVEAFG
jgi:hypothetical protein